MSFKFGFGPRLPRNPFNPIEFILMIARLIFTICTYLKGRKRERLPRRHY